jgi:hypothetical protein
MKGVVVGPVGGAVMGALVKVQGSASVEGT